MKFITALLLTVLFAFTCPLFFPWWSFAVSSFIIALLIKQRPLKSFLSGFVAVFLLWIIHALTIDNANGQILSERMAALFSLNGSSLIVLTGLLGGVISGMAALSGSFVHTKRPHREMEEEMIEEHIENLEVS